MTFHDTMTLYIPDPPQVKQRPRVYTIKGKAHGVTPAPTLQAEKRIRSIFRQCYPDADPIEGEVAMRLDFWMADRRRRDLDNLVKLVLDALNAIAYEDDSQIARNEAERYLPDTKVPRKDGKGLRNRRKGDPLTYKGEPHAAGTRIIIIAREGR